MRAVGERGANSTLAGLLHDLGGLLLRLEEGLYAL